MNIKMSANCFSRCNAGVITSVASVKKTLIITLLRLKFVELSFSFPSSSSMLLSPSCFSACSFLPRHQYLPLPLGLLFLRSLLFLRFRPCPFPLHLYSFSHPFWPFLLACNPPLHLSSLLLRFITGRVEMKKESSLVSLGCGKVSSCRLALGEVAMLSVITGVVGGGVVLCILTDAQCHLSPH